MLALHNCQHREEHLLRYNLWVFLAQPLHHVEEALLQGMCDIVGMPHLKALQREQAVLPHRHRDLGLPHFNEKDACMSALQRCRHGRSNLICGPRLCCDG